jgi:hypothetical protein
VVDHGLVRETLREHILDHMVVKPGESPLGEVVTELRLHSVPLLSEAISLDPKVPGNALFKRGLVRPGLPTPPLVTSCCRSARPNGSAATSSTSCLSKMR